MRAGHGPDRRGGFRAGGDDETIVGKRLRGAILVGAQRDRHHFLFGVRGDCKALDEGEGALGVRCESVGYRDKGLVELDQFGAGEHAGGSDFVVEVRRGRYHGDMVLLGRVGLIKGGEGVSKQVVCY